MIGSVQGAALTDLTTLEYTELDKAELEEVNRRTGFAGFRDEVDATASLLLTEEPFWAAVYRGIRKLRTREISTAGVCVDKGGSPSLAWNPDFVGALPLPHVKGLLIHELLHLVLMHVTMRRRAPHSLWNVATDLAINSLIDPGRLPTCCLYPGPRPTALGPWQPMNNPKEPKRREMTTEERDLNDYVTKLIESFKPNLAADAYFEALMQDEQVKKSLGAGGTLEIILSDDGPAGALGSGMDSHDPWEGIDDSTREVASEIVRGLIEDAVRKADERNSWGSVPQHLEHSIRASLSRQVDWRTLLRQFLGFRLSASSTSSIKRINRRYPYVHPGRKVGHNANILVAMDQSGSVGDDNVAEMFGELESLSSQYTFTIIPFDTEVDEKELVTWKRGQKRPAVRNRCGGTDFNAPTRFFNANRDTYEALVIMSDGECSKPDACLGPRAYIIVPDRKLLFEPESSDIVIQMNSKQRQ